MFNFRLTLLMVCLGALTFGCTRPGAANNSKVSLSVGATTMKAKSAGGVGAVDDYQLGIVIINISGAGISPTIFYQWDGSKNGAADLPSSLAFDVPKGSARLIQVLKVYKSNTTGKMIFQYGDPSVDLNADAQTVVIETHPEGVAASEGHVMGRYFATPLSGPTGTLTGYFQPADGSPAMRVIDGAMFGGWFNLTFLDSAKFTYKLDDVEIFKNLSLSSFAGSSSVLRVSLPSYTSTYNNDLKSASEIVMGAFGPGAPASFVACYDQALNVTIPNAATTDATPLPLAWNGDFTATVGVHPEATVGGTTSSGTAYTLADGSTCAAAATEFSSHLIFHHELAANGHDQLAGFKGPFKYTINADGSSQAIAANLSGALNNDLTLTWNFLPGVELGALGINGVTAFARLNPGSSNSNDSLQEDNGLACNRITNAGYVEYTGGITVLAPNSIKLLSLASNTQVVLCPYAQVAGKKIYFNAGQEAYFSGTPTGPAAASLDLRIAGSQLPLSGGFATNSVSIRKVDIFDNAHKIVFYAGSQPLSSSQVGAAYFSLDGGSTFTALTVFSETIGPFSGIAALDHTTFNDIGGTTTATKMADSNVIFKFTVTAATKAQYGLASDTYQSGLITLLGTGGSTLCPSPGTLQVFDEDLNAVTTMDAILNAFGAAPPPVQKKLRLRWSGCPGAQVALDNLTLTTYSACLGIGDIQAGASVAEFIVKPYDRGANCLIDASNPISLTVNTGGTSTNITQSTGSHTINHDAVATRLGVVLADASSTSLTAADRDLELLLDFTATGTGTALNLQSVKLNASSRITTTSDVGSSALVWSFMDTLSWLGSKVGAFISDMTPSTAPAASVVHALKLTDGSLQATIPNAVFPSQTTVLSTSTSFYYGASPLMLVDDASGFLKVQFYPSNGTGTAIGSGLASFNVPGTAASPSFAKMLSYNISGVNYIFVVAQYGANAIFNIGALAQVGGANYVVNWSGTKTISDQIVDTILNTSNVPMILSNVGSHNIDELNMPTFDGTALTWSGGDTGAANSVGYLSGGATGFSQSLGFTYVNSELFAMGVGSDGHFKANSISNDALTNYYTLTDGVALSGVSGAAGVTFNGNGRLFVTYSNTSSTVTYHAFDGDSGSCSGSARQNLTITPSPTKTLPSTVPGVMAAAPSNLPGRLDGIDGAFFFAHQSGVAGFSAISMMKALPCSSGVLPLSSSSLYWALLPVAASNIKGLQPQSNSQVNQSFTLFGLNLLDQLHSN